MATQRTDRPGAWGRACWRLLTVAVLPLVLSGCLRSDLTLHFDHRTHGEIRQTIVLGDGGAALARPTLEPWLEEVAERSRPLGGRLRRSPQTATLTLPFGTASDLVTRFGQVFTTAAAPPDAPPGLDLPGGGPVPFELAVEQTNWGLASRTHLTYRVDLQALPANDETDPWADLRLRLEAPWGLAAISPLGTPPLARDATGATWALTPNSITEVDAVFWLPNAIALGSVGLGLLALAGYGLRYRGRHSRGGPA